MPLNLLTRLVVRPGLALVSRYFPLSPFTCDAGNWPWPVLPCIGCPSLVNNYNVFTQQHFGSDRIPTAMASYSRYLATLGESLGTRVWGLGTRVRRWKYFPTAKMKTMRCHANYWCGSEVRFRNSPPKFPKFLRKRTSVVCRSSSEICILIFQYSNFPYIDAI